jgi:effector-binding domain-containing protein
VNEVRPDYAGKFAFQRTEPFRCLTAVHEGEWTELPQTYRQQFGSIAEQSLRPTGLSREVFLNVDFAEPAANVTEVQIGVQ